MKSKARLHEISKGGLRQQTPAPLLCTWKGQLPYLPVPLARLATPEGTTRLHSTTSAEWQLLNANSKLSGEQVFGDLGMSAKQASCSEDVILFLTSRAMSSGDMLTETPGKHDVVHSTSDASRRVMLSPSGVVRLHATLGTDFAVSVSDGMALHGGVRGSVMERRTGRNERMQSEFMRAARATGCGGVVLSVQGGDCVRTRARLGRAAVEAGDGDVKVEGVAIEGLYAGESGERREECVKAVADAVGGRAKVLLLLGGSGAPWEVLNAVRAGVDVVEGDYPGEMAALGMALRLGDDDAPICARARRWSDCRAPLAKGCACFVCRGYSIGYVRHLLEVHEMMARSLLAAHNLWQYLNWFARLRHAIACDHFHIFFRDFCAKRHALRARPTTPS